MDFFDNFSATSINTSKWSTYTWGDGVISESGGKLSVSSSAGGTKLEGKTPLTTSEITTTKFSMSDISFNTRYRQEENLGGEGGIFNGQIYVYGVGYLPYYVSSGVNYTLIETFIKSTNTTWNLVGVYSNVGGAGSQWTPIILNGDQDETYSHGNMNLYLIYSRKYSATVLTSTVDKDNITTLPTANSTSNVTSGSAPLLTSQPVANEKFTIEVKLPEGAVLTFTRTLPPSIVGGEYYPVY